MRLLLSRELPRNDSPRQGRALQRDERETDVWMRQVQAIGTPESASLWVHVGDPRADMFPFCRSVPAPVPTQSAPANALIEPLMLAVLAERTAQSPLSITVGTDLGRKWHAWVARLPLSHDGPAFLANHLERLALFANACFRALILLFISVCNMWG